MQVTRLMKDWDLEFVKEGEFEIVNRDQASQERRFFRIVPGPYSPVIEEEPEKALNLGVNNYVDPTGQPTAPAMKLKGIIVKDQKGPKGKILYRGNLTNFFGKDAGMITSDCDEIEVGGARYKLYRLVAENKNRIRGYIGFYLPLSQHDGGAVELMEVENLA